MLSITSESLGFSIFFAASFVTSRLSSAVSSFPLFAARGSARKLTALRRLSRSSGKRASRMSARTESLRTTRAGLMRIFQPAQARTQR